MGILRFNYHSEVLGMYTDITITYPTGRYTVWKNSKWGRQDYPAALNRKSSTCLI